MYFKLEVSEKTSRAKNEPNVRIRFNDEQIEVVSISKHANETKPKDGELTKKELVVEKLSEPKERAFLSDFAASTCTALFLGGALNGNTFLQMMLKLCSRTLERMGLTAISDSSFDDEINNFQTITVFVPGTQDTKLLERRVGTEFKMEQTIRKPFTVIWSGRNPGTESVEHQDESEAMKILRSQVGRKLNGGRSDIEYKRTLKEDQSTNTIENINNIFTSGRYLNVNTPDQAFVIVSSTFHLIRLAKRIIDIIAHDEYEVRKYLRSVFFVGAEQLGDIEIADGKLWASVKEKELVKLMMFDIYNQNME